MKCKSCGKEIHESSNYCDECLEKLFGDSKLNYSRPVSGGFTTGITKKVITNPDNIILASDNMIDKFPQKVIFKKTKDKKTDFSKISILKKGDIWEQKYYKFISKDFPNYEKFWQTFILPKRKKGQIRLKSNTSENDEYICMCNYTIFRKLISAKSKISKAMISDVDPEEMIDTCVEGYFHLGSALDLVYKFLMVIGIEYIKNIILHKITEEKMIEKVVKYYRKRYNSDYKDFIENQKYVSINIHNSANYIKKAFAEYNISRFKKPFTKLFQIRDLVIKYRNPFVHNPIIGNIQGRIPKKKYVKEFLNWSQIEKIIDKPKIIEEKFTDIVLELENDYNNTLIILNNIWGILTNNLLKGDRD